MKLHDLQPAEGSRQPRTRVGRGIAAGKGKTAGRGTKGQKARAGGSIPPWFEGGQTPLHMRIPKLRGFKNRFRIEYEVVNIGAIGALAEQGAFELEAGKKATRSAPVTINQDILRAVGLVRTLNKPMKILGAGELSVPLFVVADAFTASARAKIEAAGGSVNVLEIPASPLAALGVTPEPDAPKVEPVDAAPAAAKPASATAETVEAPAVKAAATKKAAAARTSPARTAATKTPETKTPETKTPAKSRASKSNADEPADGDGPLPPAEAEPPSGDDA
jgi:large subunit ribosomal protein L15